MCSLRDVANQLEQKGVKIYGASLDGVKDMAGFVEKEELNFPLLSDPDGSAARRFGVLKKDAKWTGRVTFVIDPEGVLRKVDDGVKVRSHGADLIASLEILMGD